jgi:hypothetical protein
MRVRNITTCALGLAAALLLTSSLAAQDTTRLRRPSDQRININKGEVALPPRVDTVYVTRYDTIRVDNTIVRVDTVTTTVTREVPFTPARLVGPMFWGVYAGSTFPEGSIDKVYTNGYHFGGVLGWDPARSFVGFRLDGGVSQLGKEQGSLTETQQGNGTSLIMHLAADAKVKVLNFGGWALYGIAGGNYNRYKRIALAGDNDLAAGTAGCDYKVEESCFANANNTSWSDKFGWNAGGGLDFRIGSQEMFIETRAMFIRGNGDQTLTVPISLGLRYF